MSLTPPFFANKPLDLLLRPGVEAEMCNRCKLGRTLDEVDTSGCDLFLSEIALAVCQQEAIDQRLNHLDTTSFALSGAYVPERDEQAMAITHGSSTDHRPDLQQAVLERMVSQDGGVPWASKSWAGKASETQICQDRAEALLSTLQGSPAPRDRIAASKLYSEDHAAQLKQLGLLTRMPGTLKRVSQVISQALRWATWQPVDDAPRYQRLALCHYGRAQRWLIVSSEAALQRAEQRVSKAQKRELATVEKPLVHFQAKRFETHESAQAAFSTLAGAWRHHHGAATELTAHKRYASKGRPSAQTSVQATLWQMRAEVCPDAEAIHRPKQHQGCFGLGTNIEASDRSDAEVIAAYKAQSQVEGGFRFLQDPLLFVSSLFVKKPARMQGLLMVMTLALLVYSVAQRRLRPA